MDKETVNIILGVIGAIVSIIGVVYGAVKYFRWIKVRSSIVVVSTPEYRTVKVLRITVANCGFRPITIVEAGLIMNNNAKLINRLDTEIGKIPLPKKIEDGDSVDIDFDITIVLNWIENLRYRFKSVYVLDAEGKCYKAKLPKDIVDRIKFIKQSVK